MPEVRFRVGGPTPGPAPRVPFDPPMPHPLLPEPISPSVRTPPASSPAAPSAQQFADLDGKLAELRRLANLSGGGRGRRRRRREAQRTIPFVENLVAEFNENPAAPGSKLAKLRQDAIDAAFARLTGGRGRRRRADAAIEAARAQGRAVAQSVADNPAVAEDNSLQDLLVPTTGDANDIQAAITESKQETFKQEFKPVENTLLDQVLSPADVRDAGVEASQKAGGIFDAQTRFLSSDLASTGQRITQGQRAAIDRQRGLSRALTRATAGNNTLIDRQGANISSLSNLLDVGSGISRSASDLASTAGGLATRRKATNRANKAAADAARTQNAIGIGTGATSLALLAIPGVNAFAALGLGALAGFGAFKSDN